MQMLDTSSSTSNDLTVPSKTKQNGLNGSTSHLKTNKIHSVANAEANAASGEEGESLDKLFAVSVILLRQAVALVNESLSDDAQLTQVSKYIPGSTIGKHLRHATDHFSLLLDSLSSGSDSSSGSGIRELELNYDVRARGTPMETGRAAARTALESCIARLQRAAPNAARDTPVKLTAVTPYLQTFRTSFGRELWFAALHAVHHWSMVRVIVGELGIQLEESFGVAPSTLVYHGLDVPLGKAKI